MPSVAFGAGVTMALRTAIPPLTLATRMCLCIHPCQLVAEGLHFPEKEP